MGSNARAGFSYQNYQGCRGANTCSSLITLSCFVSEKKRFDARSRNLQSLGFASLDSEIGKDVEAEYAVLV
jgi:hypothetical protein